MDDVNNTTEENSGLSNRYVLVAVNKGMLQQIPLVLNCGLLVIFEVDLLDC